MADYSNSFGMGAGLSSTPRIQYQISLARESRDAARLAAQERAQQKADADKLKRAQKELDITEKDIKIDPSKYHRLVRGEAEKLAIEMHKKVAKSFDENPVSGLYHLSDELTQYKHKLANLADKSAGYFDYEKLSSKDFVKDPQAEALLRTGTPEDFYAYVTAMGKYKNINIQEDPDTGAPNVAFKKVPQRDLDKEYATLGSPKSKQDLLNTHDIIQSGWTGKVVGGVGNWQTTATLKPQAGNGLIQEHLDQEDAIDNLVMKTPVEEIMASGVDMQDPQQISDWAKGQLELKALRNNKPITSVEQRNYKIPTPDKTAKAEANRQLKISGTTAENDKVRLSSKLVKQGKNNFIHTTFNTILKTKGAKSEGANPIATFDEKIGSESRVQGMPIGIVHDMQTGEMKLELSVPSEKLKKEFDAFYAKYPDEQSKDIKLQSEQYKKELNILNKKAEDSIQTSKRVSVDLTQSNSDYLKAKLGFDYANDYYPNIKDAVYGGKHVSTTTSPGKKVKDDPLGIFLKDGGALQGTQKKEDNTKTGAIQMTWPHTWSRDQRMNELKRQFGDDAEVYVTDPDKENPRRFDVYLNNDIGKYKKGQTVHIYN